MMTAIDYKSKADKFHSIIAGARNAAVITHINPDPDALGSSLALREFLLSKGIRCTVYVHNRVPAYLEFLPGADTIIPYSDAHSTDFDTIDLLIGLDFNETKRAGDLENILVSSNARKIIADHHLNPTVPADLIVSDTDSASTGEIIYKLIKHDTSFKPAKDFASNIYAAIMSDTGGFRFERTTGDTFRIAAELVDAGAEPCLIYDAVYNNQSSGAVKLLGKAMSGIRILAEGRLLIMSISKADFDESGAGEDDIENFSERLLTVEGVKVGILVSEIAERNETRISFRSKKDVNIRPLAAEFGGGGHAQASGARIKDMPFEDAKSAIIEKAIGLLNSITA